MTNVLEMPYPDVKRLNHLLEDIATSLQDDDSTAFKQVFEAAFNSLAADLSAEDRDWIAASAGYDASTTALERRRLIELSRRYWKHDGNCRQLIGLYVDFSVGRGFGWRVEDESHRDTITRYWESRENRPLLSATGQRKTARKLLTDGELLRLHFLDGKSIVTRHIDPMDVPTLVVDPDDSTRVLGYVREKDNDKWFYRDWTNMDGEPGVRMDDPKQVVTNYEEGVVLHHVAFNADESGRGVPLLTPCLIWAKVQRHFMRIRAAIQQALAMFAWKAKVKGSQETINALKNQFSVGTDTADDTHYQQTPPGSTWWENEGVNLQAMKQETGADAARVDGGMNLQMLGVGAGIFPHYLGAGESFRLATAGAMEPPMAKRFEAFQQLLMDEYRYEFQFVIEQSLGQTIEDRYVVDFDAPRIQSRDSTKWIHALNETLSINPGLKLSRDFLKLLALEMDIKDVDPMVDRLLVLLEEYKDEQEQKEQQKAAQFQQSLQAKQQSQVPDNTQVKDPKARGSAEITNQPAPK